MTNVHTIVLSKALRERGWKISTAESCTGGMIASTLTDVEGSSDWFESGFVTYSVESKALLGVPRFLMDGPTGCYNHDVAIQMAKAARVKSGAHVGLSTTGFAERPPDNGPNIWIGVSIQDGIEISFPYRIEHSIRSQYKQAAVDCAIACALNIILNPPSTKSSE